MMENNVNCLYFLLFEKQFIYSKTKLICLLFLLLNKSYSFLSLSYLEVQSNRSIGMQRTLINFTGQNKENISR